MIQIVIGTLAFEQLFSSGGSSRPPDSQVFTWVSAALPLGESLLLVLTSSLLIISMLLLGECLAAWLPPIKRSATTASTAPPPSVILMPAHDEATVITETVMAIQHQLRQDPYLSQTELWVIADNCSDATAELARQAGAQVWERIDATARGKGYALDFGLRQMAPTPPEVVVMIDADCRVQPGAIAALVQAAMLHQRPIQGNYYMVLPGGNSPSETAGLKDRITAFATRVKNEVRSAGLSQLGMPCLLVGAGMAFPWQCLQSVNLASGELVEDMKLGFDLAIAQQPPLFCREAIITADLPQNEAAAQSQRTRWEHGRLDLSRRYWPKLIAASLQQGRLGPISLALDMAILPLSLLVTFWVMLTAVTAVFSQVGGGVAPLKVCLASGSCIGAAVLLAWIQVGRQVLPLRQLLLVPVFILWKLPIFLRFLVKPQRHWVRTERDVA